MTQDIPLILLTHDYEGVLCPAPASFPPTNAVAAYGSNVISKRTHAELFPRGILSTAAAPIVGKCLVSFLGQFAEMSSDPFGSIGVTIHSRTPVPQSHIQTQTHTHTYSTAKLC